MANETKKYVSYENLQTFKNNLDNTFATQESVEELSVDVAYINVEDNASVENPDIENIETSNIVIDSALSTTSTNPVQNKVVAAELNQLSNEIVDLEGKIPSEVGGLTAAQISALDGMFKAAAYTKDVVAEYAAFKAAFGIYDGGTEPDDPDTEKTLTSISAIYSGGNVPAGTAATALTGITVTATYSDGSTAAVTGYTLSGTIAEGSNTITVSYGGKTTTFTVTGTAESGGSDAVNLYSGELVACTNLSNAQKVENTVTYTVDANGALGVVTVEGLETDKGYTIFVESTRKDNSGCYTECRLQTKNGWVQGEMLAKMYPSWANAGKHYATFTATGETLYLHFCEMGVDAIGTSPTLSIYVYEGTLTERP